MTKLWKRGLRIGALALALIPSLAAADDTALLGNWLRDNHTVRIAVSQCGNNVCVVNTWVKRPKGNEHIGDGIVLTLKPVSSTEFKGRAYDLRRHLTYGMTITLQGANMETSGCILFGVICKSTGWQRID
jgi:uncharacterized protein (DUF2147 family)